MKAIPLEARKRNLGCKPSRDHVAICEWCGDEGLIVVWLRSFEDAQIEEFGPCPFCQVGYEREFSSKEWPDGFWQGREEIAVEKLYPSGTMILPPAEQRRMARALAQQMGVILKDIG